MTEIEINKENFENTINDNTPIVVDFWASWCGPCQMMMPIFEELSKEYTEDKLRFGKCSTEECPEAASNYNITSIPCLIIFKAGKEVDRIVGFNNKDILKTKIDEILNKI
jgi:thioredoxin 1